MPVFSDISQKKLSTCDNRLQEVCSEVIHIMDCTILDGHRDKERQEQLFWEGKSQLHYPKSKHNTMPSKAVDIAPYPINWKDKEGFCFLAGLMKGVAHNKGVRLRWGGDWNGNGNRHDQKFHDLPHFEIME